MAKGTRPDPTRPFRPNDTSTEISLSLIPIPPLTHTAHTVQSRRQPRSSRGERYRCAACTRCLRIRWLRLSANRRSHSHSHAPRLALFLVAGQDLRCVWLICSLLTTTSSRKPPPPPSPAAYPPLPLRRSSSSSDCELRSALFLSRTALRSQLPRLSEKLLEFSRSLDSFALPFCLGCSAAFHVSY